MRLGAIILLLFTASLEADTYHLTNPSAPGVTTNPGQTLQTASTANSGWTPAMPLSGTNAFFYSPAFSGAFAAGNWQLIIWTNQPGCASNVTAEIGYSNGDGTGFVSLGSQTIDVNTSGAGNHTTTFSYNGLPFTNVVSKSLRVRLQVTSGCNPTMAYNAGVDFDTRLITPALGLSGTPTWTPTFTRSPTATPTLAPALNKSVNTATALNGQTITYTIHYQNPNTPAGSSCQDTFEPAATGWAGGWSAPTGGVWGFINDNGPTLPGSRALDATSYGGFNFTDINCAGMVTDGYIQSDVKIMTANGEMTLLWRRNGSSTYQFHIKQGTAGNISLRVITSAAFNEIAIGNASINQSQWYQLRFEVIGFSLRGYINGALVLTATDPNLTYNSGAASLEVDDAPGSGINTRFDNVIISNYAKEWWNVTLVDTLPAGLTYVSSGCGGTVNGQVVTMDLGDIPAGSSGDCQIVARVNTCPASLNNKADIWVGLPAHNEPSNTVNTTVSCSSPTPSITRTPTRTPTPTFTATRTATPTPSPTPTFTVTFSPTRTNTPSPSPTLTATPSATPTLTATRTNTQSATRTDSPSLTATPSQTLTRTPTLTSTASATVTFSPTPSATTTVSSTRTSTPSFTNTPTATPSRTPSLTATQSATSTLSATPTHSPTQTYTRTPTATFSDTRTLTATPSNTEIFTPTFSPTRTATQTLTPTPSHTRTVTATPTYTVSKTATSTSTATPTTLDTSTSTPTRTQTLTSTPSPSPSLTPTRSVTTTVSVTRSSTPSRTASPTVTSSPSSTSTRTITLTPSPSPSSTASFTATPTPLTMPWQIEISCYNEAGERVRTLYQGGSEKGGADAQFSAESFAAGLDKLSIIFSGRLKDGQTSLAWSGDNDQGQDLDTGVYYLHIKSTDAFGQVSSLIHPVSVLKTPPSASIGVFNSAGELVAKLNPPANVGAISWAQLDDSLMVAGLKSLSIGLRGGLGASTLLWDGKKTDGGFVSPGIYTVMLHSQGYSATLSFTVLKASETEDPAPVAAPNPARFGDSKLVIKIGLSRASRQVRLYNAAGELAGTRQAGPGDEKVEFGLDRLAGGVYIATVQNKLTRKISSVKICVVQ